MEDRELSILLLAYESGFPIENISPDRFSKETRRFWTYGHHKHTGTHTLIRHHRNARKTAHGTAEVISAVYDETRNRTYGEYQITSITLENIFDDPIPQD